MQDLLPHGIAVTILLGLLGLIYRAGVWLAPMAEKIFHRHIEFVEAAEHALMRIDANTHEQSQCLDKLVEISRTQAERWERLEGFLEEKFTR